MTVEQQFKQFQEVWSRTFQILPKVSDSKATISNGMSKDTAKAYEDAAFLSDAELVALADQGKL